MSGDIQAAKVDLASLPNGVYDDIPNAAYHTAAGISKSGLDLIEQSPLHYWDKYLNPDKPEQGNSEALLMGSLTHTLTFEPELLEAEYAVVPPDAPRKPTLVQRNAKKPSPETVAAIEWWDSFNAASSGKRIVDEDMIENARKIADAVRAHPAAGHFLGMPGHSERTVLYRHPEYEGLLCKCRTDRWIDLDDGRILIADLKTTQDAKPGEFERHAWDYRYQVAAAWYSDIIHAVTGREVAGFVLFAVEKSRPYAVSVRVADDVFLAEGRKAYRHNLDTYALCMKSGKWPGYGDHLLPIGPPRWVLDAINRKWR